ncbi:CSC1-like protein HYP1 [Impatiens glandulifera]|uniref:CSC1-like protein HYP1 n=1 Tax=Impatiens glandulifera TaxID=253017 RepID=UPI001FB08974|nr:CSC1-like protein HYP1 [Impatiens glandulifera]
MLVYALLTSVGINFALCVIFFTLYSILRKQPGNNDVYAPRMVNDQEYRERSHFKLERLLPNPGWVGKVWQDSEDDLLQSSGLDAVVFMRIIVFSLRVFCVAGIIGLFVLLPVNCSGNQLEIIDFANFTNDSLDVFSISNVNNGSNSLWIHFAAVYVVTIFICCLLYHEYGYISAKRVAYFHMSKPQPQQFTILVRGIPVSKRSSVGSSVESFFGEYHPSTYLSYVVVCRTNRIRNLMDEMQNLYKRIIDIRTERTRPKARNGCFCGLLGLLGHKNDHLDHYEKKLENLEDHLRLEQSQNSQKTEVRAAFVSFKSRYGAATALYLQQSTNPTEWITEQAPEPDDVNWPFFSSTFMGRWISKLVVIFACIIFTILFLLPVVLVQGLSNLSQLEAWFPFLEGILSSRTVAEVVTGYLPSLILLLFLKIVPPIMWLFSSVQGYISNSQILRSACEKVVWFTIWNVFFANVLSGSAFSNLYIFLDPKTIPLKLGVLVPQQASFFVAYVVTSGWTSASLELFRMFPFIWSLVTKPCNRRSLDENFQVPDFPYHKDIPRLLLFGLLGITYFFLAPLILPFLLIYFCMAYIVYRNQFINVYAPKFETGGRFWPIVHNAMIFSLVLMHAIAVGIFTVKKLPMAASLVFPLPILTLIFNAYCRKRFLPNFNGYSAESLIKKDREDLKQETGNEMEEFYEKLRTAYEDPAFMPIQYSTVGPHESSSSYDPLLTHEIQG